MNEHGAPPDDEKLIDLVVRYLDGELPPAEEQLLGQLLAADEHNRAVFVDVCLQAKLCAEILGHRLQDNSAAGRFVSSADPIPIEVEPPSTGSALLGFLSASLRAIPGGEFTVGLLVVCAVLGATWGLARLHAHLTGSDVRTASQEAIDPARFVATVTACEDCRWGDKTQSAERADRLKAGRLELEAGVAEITFDCGARVVIEGPATLAIETARRAHLAIGRLVAHVPAAARGFTIASPSVTVVDLGTEFGLDVDAAGTAEVQVFQGKVELRPAAAAAADVRPLLLEVSGQARFDVQTGQIKPRPQVHSAQFVRSVDQKISRPRLTLVEEGGTFAAGNLAQQKGAWAFAENVLLGYPYHRIEYLTDGRYGNDRSWIAGDTPSFGGVVLSGEAQIDSVAFGRDNTATTGPAVEPAQTGYRDRWAGSYTIQYSNAPRTNQPPPADSWHTIDAVKYAPDMPEIVSEHIHPYLRHRFRFTPVRATAVRILTSQPGTGIDELEVYGTPLDAVRK